MLLRIGGASSRVDEEEEDTRTVCIQVSAHVNLNPNVVKTALFAKTMPDALRSGGQGKAGARGGKRERRGREGGAEEQGHNASVAGPGRSAHSRTACVPACAQQLHSSALFMAHHNETCSACLELPQAARHTPCCLWHSAGL
jgi:hypothetical protein